MADAVAESLRRETVFDLDAFDGKKIWCVVNHAGDKPSPRAIILSHGLTGDPAEYIHMAARDYFTARGYDVYRFAYYKSRAPYRLLHECTLNIHARDLNTVIAHVRQSHEKVFVCGHSYGGLTMLFANPGADAISFWDSAFDPWNEFWSSEIIDFPALNMHGLAWGSIQLVGPAMVEEARQINHEKAAAMAAALTAPAQIIIAENGGLPNGRAIFDHHPGPKDILEIAGASHRFIDGIIICELLKATEDWLKGF